MKIARSSHSHASPRSPARAPFTPQATAALRGEETIGRTLGSPAFLDRLAVNLPIQSTPIKRMRVTRGSFAVASGGISASQLGIPMLAPFASGVSASQLGIPMLAPFASGDAVGPSLNFGGFLQVGPFARADAVNPSVKVTDWLSIGPFDNDKSE